jgi:hypothetical protein
VGAALVVALAGLGVWWRSRGDGGLPHKHPEVLAVLAPMNPSDTSFSFGTAHIRAAGKTLQIVSVQPLMSGNMEFLGANTIWPTDNEQLATTALGFPAPLMPRQHPMNQVIPASVTGAPYEGPGDDHSPVPVGIALGFRIRSGDIGAVNGFMVTYKVNGDTYRQFFPDAVIACAKPNPCGPKTDPGSVWSGQTLYSLGLAPKPSG